MARFFKPTGSLFDLVLVILTVGLAHVLFEGVWARLGFYIPATLVLSAISAKLQARYWRPAVRK